jgi:signal transduction histidine kinase
VQALIEQLTPALGARPQVTVAGPVDDVPLDVAANLLAVVRESLTNASKHAHATGYGVVLRVADDLSLEVTDNGIGMPPADSRGSGMGLGNLLHRAERLGGTFEIEAIEGGGTRVSWRVPL